MPEGRPPGGPGAPPLARALRPRRPPAPQPGGEPPPPLPTPRYKSGGGAPAPLAAPLETGEADGVRACVCVLLLLLFSLLCIDIYVRVFKFLRPTRGSSAAAAGGASRQPGVRGPARRRTGLSLPGPSPAPAPPPSGFIIFLSFTINPSLLLSFLFFSFFPFKFAVWRGGRLGWAPNRGAPDGVPGLLPAPSRLLGGPGRAAFPADFC